MASVWYGMVWYGMVWYGMVWYGMVWYGMVWHGMASSGIEFYKAGQSGPWDEISSAIYLQTVVGAVGIDPANAVT